MYYSASASGALLWLCRVSEV